VKGKNGDLREKEEEGKGEDALKWKGKVKIERTSRRNNGRS
jgi:hypothetical protein